MIPGEPCSTKYGVPIKEAYMHSRSPINTVGESRIVLASTLGELCSTKYGVPIK
jgi:hypothetical protein